LSEINGFLKEQKFPLINYNIFCGLNDIVWNTDYIESKFNFIDIIKGFIPLSFSRTIGEITHNRTITKSIIYKYRQKLYLTLILLEKML
jgi:hypothetical protein